MTRDEFGRRLLTEDDACGLLYADPNKDISAICLVDASKHNAAVKKNYSDLSLIRELEQLTIDPAAWHHQNQSHWWMPSDYVECDIAAWILERCEGEVELQRCGSELLEYAKRDLLPLLRYLRYLVDTLRANGIIWGVGRGSSVASFVLYKIGVHRINSIEHDLDFNEFMR